MYLRLFAAVLALLIGSSLPAAAQSSQSATTATLNMRLGPGTQFGIITQIPLGQWVQVLGCTNPISWCQVRYVTRQGWVSASFLSPRPTLAMPLPVPVPQPQPFPPFPGFPAPPFFDPFPGTSITGTLTNEGVECQAMRGDNGRLYTLTGNLGPFRPGNRVRVRGQVAQVSFCSQGTTIQVQAIQPAF